MSDIFDIDQPDNVKGDKNSLQGVSGGPGDIGDAQSSRPRFGDGYVNGDDQDD